MCECRPLAGVVLSTAPAPGRGRVPDDTGAVTPRPGAGRKKGTPNKRTQERERLISQAAATIEGLLPEPFKGDAHALLMTVYKDTTNPLKDRLAAATAAIGYEKPKLAAIEPPPMAQSFLQQSEGSHDIGLNEFRRLIDRAVDMTLRGEVHHITRPVALEQTMQRRAVANIHLFKSVAV